MEKTRLKAVWGAMWEVGGTLMRVQEEMINIETKENGGGDGGEGVVLKA